MSSDDPVRERAEGRVGATLACKYRLDRVLGVGGMAAVYAATHRNGRSVALKLLHPELSTRTDIRQRFLREGHAANAVEHAGVVNVIDDDVAEDGSAFLVMELLEGRSVEELWEASGQRLPPETVLAIARELCDVLGAAHRVGVVHRDIKPANLFVTVDGALKVLDFGIARVRDAATTQLTATGTALGTPAFMAPEQASGRTSQIDERTDLWAAGATMFMLLSGRLVHEGETPQHVVVLSATEQARSLATVMPAAPTALVDLVDRALRLDKAARWPTAETMGEAIREVSVALFGQESLPVLPAVPSRVSPSTALATSGSETPAKVVGSTTSSPVSSGSSEDSTKVYEGRRRRGGTLIVQTFTSAIERLRVVVRYPGADVVSVTGPTTHGVFRRPLSWAAHAVPLIVLGGAALGTMAIAVKEWPAPAPRATVDPSPALAPPAGATATPAAATAAAQPAAAAEEAMTGAPEGSPASSATPPASAPRQHATAIVRPPQRPPPRPAPVPAPPRKPGLSARDYPSPKAGCSPAYVIDSNGKTVWKKECL